MQTFFVPPGALHHIENFGEQEGELILAFSIERVEDFGLSGTFGAFTDAVLGNTTGLPAPAFAGLKLSLDDTFIGSRANSVASAQQERSRRLFPPAARHTPRRRHHGGKGLRKLPTEKSRKQLAEFPSRILLWFL